MTIYIDILSYNTRSYYHSSTTSPKIGGDLKWQLALSIQGFPGKSANPLLFRGLYPDQALNAKLGLGLKREKSAFI